MAAATSRGAAKRPSGVSRSMRARSAPGHAAADISVSVMLGATQLTRIPSAISSRAQ